MSLSSIKLSRQEEKITMLAMSGCSDQQVAEDLNLSVDTVRTYWKRIRKKMEGKTRAQVISHLSREPLSQMIRTLQMENVLLKEELARVKRRDRLHRQIFESHPDALVIYDREDCVVEMNASARRLFEVESKDVQGQPLTNFIPSSVIAAHSTNVEDQSERLFCIGHSRDLELCVRCESVLEMAAGHRLAIIKTAA